MRKLLIILTAMACAIALSVPVTGQAQCDNNLVANGDFELGNIDFSSDYNYIPPTPNSLGAPGTYTVYINPANVRSGWFDYGDNTTGSGNMLIANAATTAANPTVFDVWKHTVSVIPNTDYVLSYYLSSCSPINPAHIVASINGTPIGVDNAPSTAGVWQKVSYTWNSGTASSAEIALEDLARLHSGDDFAIDDVCFVQGPIPAISGCIKIYGEGREGLEVHLNQKPNLKDNTITDSEGCFEFQDLLDPNAKFDLKVKCPELDAP